MQRRTFKDRWDSLELGTKIITLLCVVASLMQIFVASMVDTMTNNIVWTVDRLELWRLFTSFLINGSGLIVIINLPLALLMILLCAPEIVNHPSCRNADCPHPSSSLKV